MKIGAYVNPISGKEGDVTNIEDTKKNVLGVAYLFGIFAVGQWLLNYAGKMIFKGKIPTQANLFSNKTATEKSTSKNYNIV